MSEPKIIEDVCILPMLVVGGRRFVVVGERAIPLESPDIRAAIASSVVQEAIRKADPWEHALNRELSALGAKMWAAKNRGSVEDWSKKIDACKASIHRAVYGRRLEAKPRRVFKDWDELFAAAKNSIVVSISKRNDPWGEYASNVAANLRKRLRGIASRSHAAHGDRRDDSKGNSQ